MIAEMKNSIEGLKSTSEKVEEKDKATETQKIPVTEV